MRKSSPKTSLMSFLKIVGMGTPQKVQEYAKFLKGGGYNFYWTLQEAARDLTIGNKPYPTCLPKVQSHNRYVERECNAAALKSLNNWMMKKKPDAFFLPPSTKVVTPAELFSVKLEPEFGYIKDGERYITQVWYSKNKSLSKNGIRLGLRLLEKHLCVGEYADCKVAILDLRKCELLQIAPLSAVLDVTISSEFALIDHIFTKYLAAQETAGELVAAK